MLDFPLGLLKNYLNHEIQLWGIYHPLLMPVNLHSMFKAKQEDKAKVISLAV